jgi:PX domain
MCSPNAETFTVDDRLVKVMLQRWLTRICEDPVLLQDEELRSFIDNDLGVRILLVCNRLV